jgi:hypothetical protein
MTSADRIACVMEFRRSRRLVATQRRGLQAAADSLSLAEEMSGDAEAELVNAILTDGEILHDGRRYTIEQRDFGVTCVRVTNLDSALARQNCPECVP